MFTPLVFSPQRLRQRFRWRTPCSSCLAQHLQHSAALPTLSYNLLIFGSFMIAFTGGRKFFGDYVGEFTATLAALVFTLWGCVSVASRWPFTHALCHESAPWFLRSLLQSLDGANEASLRQTLRRIAVSGLFWGLMIDFSLYSLFHGAVGLAIGGRRWFSPKQFLKLIGIGAPLRCCFLRPSFCCIMLVRCGLKCLNSMASRDKSCGGAPASIAFLPFRSDQFRRLKAQSS